MSEQRYTAEQVIEAIKKARGIKAVVARSLGCDRSTVNNYIERYPTVKRAYEEQREVIIDIAEGQLIKKVDSGEWDAVKYVLSTLGKDRGYGDTIKHEGGLTIKVIYADDRANAS